MLNRISCAILACILSAEGIRGIAANNCKRDQNETVLNLCFTSNYSTTIPPKPAEITFTFQEEEIISIDQKKQTITSSLEYMISWLDDRIQFADSFEEDATILAKEMDRFWMPRLRVLKLVDADSYSFLGDINLFWVDKSNFPKTTVRYSSVVKVETKCEMNFAKFPFDHQNCSVKFKNRFHGYQNIKMHNYGLVETPKDSQEYLITSSPIQDEDNGIVGVMFSFERYSYPFVSKYYLPCFGLTILTSISFLIPPKSIPGRAGMLVTLCLVLNNIFISSKDETPASKTPTSLTSYIFGCMNFAFVAIIYYGVVLFLIRKPQKGKVKHFSTKDKSKNDEDDQYVKVDRFMFVIYMTTFILYNIVYFFQFVDRFH